MPWFCMCVCPHVACVLQLSPGIWGPCMPHYYKHSCSLYPTARLENATHGHLSSCWFTGSQSQSCRGCPPPLGWGRAQNQKMDGWIGGYFTSLHPIELVTHFTFFLHLLQIIDHISISVSLMKKKLLPQREKANLWGTFYFYPKDKAKLFIICLDLPEIILWTLVRDSDFYCWPCK